MQRSALALAVVTALVSACASDSSKPKPPALRLCEQALRGHNVASAQLTTVGEVRHWRIGPNNKPALHAFGSATDRSQAAWCWTTDGHASWSSYGIGPHDEKVGFGTLGGVSATPTGPPAFP
jgi:hypothetical protein